MTTQLQSYGSTRSLSIGLIIMVALCSLSAAGCSSSESDGPTPVLSGPPATTFPMPPVETGSVSDLGWVLLEAVEKGSDQIPRGRVSDYRGRVLILDLYATWCAPCRESIPRLIDLHHKYEKKGLEIVGLNVGGADDRIKVADFAKEFGIPYPLGFPDQALSDLLLSDDVSIPQTFVFNRDGRLVKRFIGYDSSMAATLEKIIQTETGLSAE